MKASDFTPGQRVIYVPFHAHGNTGHPDCESGVVTSVSVTVEGGRGTVFVRFGADYHAKGCYPETLVPEAA